MLPRASRAEEFESLPPASCVSSKEKRRRGRAATSVVLDGLEFDLSNLAFPASSKTAGVTIDNRNDMTDSCLGGLKTSCSSIRSRGADVGSDRDIDEVEPQNYAVLQDDQHALQPYRSEASLGGGAGEISIALPPRVPLPRMKGPPISYPDVFDIPSSLDLEEIFQKCQKVDDTHGGIDDNVISGRKSDEKATSASASSAKKIVFNKEGGKDPVAVSEVSKMGSSKGKLAGHSRGMDARHSKVGLGDYDNYYVRHRPPPPESYSTGGLGRPTQMPAQKTKRIDGNHNKLPQPKVCWNSNSPHHDSDHSPSFNTMSPKEVVTPPRLRLEKRSHLWHDLFVECGILDRSPDQVGDELDDDKCTVDSANHTRGGSSSSSSSSVNKNLDPCLPSAPSYRHRSPSYRQRRSANTEFDQEERPLVEVTPGTFVPLRDSMETRRAAEQQCTISTRCKSCACQLRCIADIDMIMCPECRVISPVDHPPQGGGGGGLGIGITEE